MKFIKELFLIIKYWLIIRPIDKIMIPHTIGCPKCHKIWYQLRKYKVGQNTLCKDCRRR